MDEDDYIIEPQLEEIFQCKCGNHTFRIHIEGWVECSECGFFASNIQVHEVESDTKH